MKKKIGFWQSLERYTWKLVARSPFRWQWVFVSLIGIILFASLFGINRSMASTKNLKEAIEKLTINGDYQGAQALLEKKQDSNNLKVLGADTDPSNDEARLEDMVYPERKVERKIQELKAKLELYPGNREIYLSLANLYGQIGNIEEAEQYREKARVLDPNGVEFN